MTRALDVTFIPAPFNTNDFHKLCIKMENKDKKLSLMIYMEYLNDKKKQE